MGVSSGLDKTLLIYSISWYYDAACPHSSSVGIVSIVVLFICTACTTNVGDSLLSFSCCFYVCPWWICTGIASAFVSASFSASMRAIMPCFPGLTTAHLIAALCLIIDRCFNLCFLIPIALYTSWILIGLHQPSENVFHLSISWNNRWKLLMCSGDRNWRPLTIQRLFRMAKYCQLSRFDEPLHNVYTWVPTSLIHCGGKQCFQVIHDENNRGGFPYQILFIVPWEKKTGYGSTPGPATIVLSLEFKYFYVIGGP